MDDHREVLCRLAITNGWKRGVEVGLGSGQLFNLLLGSGLEMVGVDLGLRPDRKAQVEWIAGHHEHATVHWMASIHAARLVPDGWADFIFIDAGHSHDAVRADLAAWEPKVREGGWFGGHDFHELHPGVIKAVRERYGKRFETLEGWIWARK